jgi:hypothetical protein
MAVQVRIVKNSLTGGIMAIAAILAVGCGPQSSNASGQASSQNSAAQSSAASQPSSPASTSQNIATPAGGSACSTSNLNLTLGDGGAAAGTDYTVLDFTNTGTTSCTLYGFPGVSLITSSGAQIGAAATRNPSTASTVVTLAPGAKANATLGVANAQNYPTGACKPTTAAQMKVFPPNQTLAIEVPFTGTGCSVSSTHQLSVTAVAAGAGQVS